MFLYKISYENSLYLIHMLLSLVYHNKTGKQHYMSFSIWGFMVHMGTCSWNS